MAKLGYRHTSTGSNLYFVITNKNNQHMQSSDFTFVTYVAANWNDYDLVATETDSYLYEYTLPTMNDGNYKVEVFLRAGVAPALTDSKLGQSLFSMYNNDFIGQSNIGDLGSW